MQIGGAGSSSLLLGSQAQTRISRCHTACGQGCTSRMGFHRMCSSATVCRFAGVVVLMRQQMASSHSPVESKSCAALRPTPVWCLPKDNKSPNLALPGAHCTIICPSLLKVLLISTLTATSEHLSAGKPKSCSLWSTTPMTRLMQDSCWRRIDRLWRHAMPLAPGPS